VRKLTKSERKKSASLLAAHSDKCNLGCGQHFHSAWDNYDCVLSRAGIRNIDLTKPLPFEKSVYNACYLSHVLEHLPRQRVSKLLSEIFVTLKPGGVIRVVVPDLETIARLYLSELETAACGDPSAMRRHEWMTLELIDQMTRTFSGGFMARTLRSRPLPHREFIEKRTGWEVRHWLEGVDRSLASGSEVLPSAEIYHFPQTEGAQEAAFRQSGEVHRWMYDRVSMKSLLAEAGFSAIKVCAADESALPNFSSYCLDTDDAGRVRKPDSLFVEAIANKHDSSCR
jgi:predicted SAM-dependent methyltransferase